MPESYLNVESSNAKLDGNFLHSVYTYEKQIAHVENHTYVVKTENVKYNLKTDLTVPKTGLMLIGWGGNNGSTLTASLLANKHKLNWKTKRGTQTANFFGSLMLSSTTKIGLDQDGEEVYMPLKNMLPMLDPKEIVLGGWDISGANLAEAMDRACVLEPDLKRQVHAEMAKLKPLPSIYYSDFIALNQADRANNLIQCGGNKQKELDTLRRDIRNFKEKNDLDKVIVLWTANTERFAELIEGTFYFFI